MEEGDSFIYHEEDEEDEMRRAEDRKTGWGNVTCNADGADSEEQDMTEYAFSILYPRVKVDRNLLTGEPKTVVLV